MKDTEVQALAKIRSNIIEYYKTLDGGKSPGTSVLLQRDVALTLEGVIKSIDTLLGGYIKFE